MQAENRKRARGLAEFFPCRRRTGVGKNRPHRFLAHRPLLPLRREVSLGGGLRIPGSDLFVSAHAHSFQTQEATP